MEFDLKVRRNKIEEVWLSKLLFDSGKMYVETIYPNWGWVEEDPFYPASSPIFHRIYNLDDGYYQIRYPDEEDDMLSKYYYVKVKGNKMLYVTLDYIRRNP